MSDSGTGLRWSDVRIVEHRAGALTVRLEVVRDFEPLLDRYAARFPNDTDMIPYYATLWPSAVALAEHLSDEALALAGRRVIELGCGMALPSVVAALRGAEVLATDFHPDNEPFVRRNAELNGVRMGYRALRWDDAPDGERFDVVLASDVLYERRSVGGFVRCATALCGPGGVIVLADPGRDALAEAARAVRAAGFTERLLAVGDIYVVVFTAGP